jgi:NADH-quinone oxidoreductase subunit G
MATIYIDNKPYEVEGGQNLLHACLSLGFDIPYFCWHPALHSVGACRQCAVKQFKDEKDIRGKIVMSCMVPVTDGIRISIDDPEAKAFRASVIEWLMTNHPHDCPVCDEGGECHLQDMTLMTGHIYRRYRFKKRTYRNQDIGPFLNHEMNRCIQCYRCVRFYRDYAGGRDLDVFASHNHVYFGRHSDGTLESEFSGNLVEVCPTGVFTDKTLKQHYTRKWDLQTAPSICIHCSLGCNTIPGERYDRLRRILNRYHGEINGYFLCDRGRYGYEFINSSQRIRQALIRDSRLSNEGKPATKKSVLKRLSTLLHFGAGVIGIGSPRASLESNFALRTLVGPDNFYTGMSEREFGLISSLITILQKGPARSPSLHEVRASDAVFVLGEDVTNTSPLLALALRQSVRWKPLEKAKKLGIPEWHDAAVRTAVQDMKGPLFIASPVQTKLDDRAVRTYYGTPDDIARLGYAVARELSSNAPPVHDLPEDTYTLAKCIAGSLSEAKRPLIVSGTGCGSKAVIQAAANIAWALCENGHKAGLCFSVPECNSLGLSLMNGRNMSEAFRAVQDGNIETVVILENDLYRRADSRTVDTFFERIKHCIVLDHIPHPTLSKADIVLPASTFAEADGTLVNNEGRMQRFFRVFVPGHEVQESWQWLRDMMVVSGRLEAKDRQSLDAILSSMAETLPVFKPITEVAPKAGFRISGMKFPRQPHRYSGRTAMTAHSSVHEPKQPDDPDSPLSFSMEGYEGIPPSSLISRYWVPGWNSVQAVNKFQKEVGGPLYGGDPGIRLIEPSRGEKPSYFDNIPGPFHPRDGAFLIIPLYHVFGSEELSIWSKGVAERSPEPYLALNPDEHAKLNINDGEGIELSLSDFTYKLPVRIVHGIPTGVGGLPHGLPGLRGIDLPAWGNVRRVRSVG